MAQTKEPGDNLPHPPHISFKVKIGLPKISFRNRNLTLFIPSQRGKKDHLPSFHNAVENICLPFVHFSLFIQLNLAGFLCIPVNIQKTPFSFTLSGPLIAA